MPPRKWLCSPQGCYLPRGGTTTGLLDFEEIVFVVFGRHVYNTCFIFLGDLTLEAARRACLPAGLSGAGDTTDGFRCGMDCLWHTSELLNGACGEGANIASQPFRDRDVSRCKPRVGALRRAAAPWARNLTAPLDDRQEVVVQVMRFDVSIPVRKSPPSAAWDKHAR